MKNIVSVMAMILYTKKEYISKTLKVYLIDL